MDDILCKVMGTDKEPHYHQTEKPLAIQAATRQFILLHAMDYLLTAGAGDLNKGIHGWASGRKGQEVVVCVPPEIVHKLVFVHLGRGSTIFINLSKMPTTQLFYLERS